MYLRVLLCCAIAIPACLIAQDANSPTKDAASSETSVKNTESQEELAKAVTLWHDRAERFTSAALEDEWHIFVFRPVLRARLAQAWWKVDLQRARPWLASAVDEVTMTFTNETNEVHQQRLRAAESVLRICEYLKEEQFAQKIIDALLTNPRQSNSKAHHSPITSSLAQSLSLAASEIGRDDPTRALKIGNALIALHSGSGINQVALSVKYKDAQGANKLYIDGLTEAMNTGDFQMAGELMQYAFPFFQNPGPAAPDAVKATTIELIGTLLTKPFTSDDDKQAFCTRAPWVAEHMVGYLPPAQQGIVQANLKSCPDREDHGDNADACTTVDACLELAENAKTPEQSARRKEIATIRAAQVKDWVRALDILDSLTPEEQEWIPAWMNDYENYSREAMVQLYKLHDSQGMQRVIDKSPDKLRAQVMLGLVDNRDVQKAKPYAIAMLTESRRILEKFPAENPMTYIEMAEMYCELLPSDGPQAFAFAVNGLNHIEYRDIDKELRENKLNSKGAFVYAKPGESIEPIPVNGHLIDEDEPYISAAIKSLVEPETRIGFRLALLRYSLRHYQEAQRKLAAAMPAPASTATAGIQK